MQTAPRERFAAAPAPEARDAAPRPAQAKPHPQHQQNQQQNGNRPGNNQNRPQDRQQNRDNAEGRDMEPAPGYALPETVGGNEGGGNSRRKRRRRNRGENNGQQNQQPAFNASIDLEELKLRAWKIYLGEVTEEGLALMDDRTAAEASRRAFRVAELFLTEAQRHAAARQAQRSFGSQAPAREEDEGDEEL